MRIGILAIQHESNTFVRERTVLDAFRRDALLTGAAMVEYCRDARHETTGFLAELTQADVEIAPLLLALATPGGSLSDDTAADLVARALDELRRAGPLDGLLVAPHGAAVSASCRDFDGHWLTEVREVVGPNVPIVGTLDPHANLSQRMIDATDALVAYRTNPHVDQVQTGRCAAQLLLRTLRGEIHPTMSAAFPPVAISIDQQATGEEPCLELYRVADALARIPGVLSNSIVLGFPYADVPELGSSIIVVTDGQPELARSMADELAQHLTDHRAKFACGLPGVDAALANVQANGERVCLLDVGDNVGGGAAGDGTLLARRLHDMQIGPAFVCLWDPEAVAQASALAVGQIGRLAMGGRHAVEQGPPLVADVLLEWRGEGRFEESEIVHGGRAAYDMGPTAVVRTDRALTILLTSLRVPPFSLRQLTSCGLNPKSFRVLVAKGVNAPIAAYRSACDRFVRVNTPGTTTADMTKLKYRHRRRPLYPFEDLI
ncbi:MAG: M81 family metallopeptidase [Pirellulales bacterium]|nr:M81 family metallopeptidase [Pirellulales bacterium]